MKRKQLSSAAPAADHLTTDKRGAPGPTAAWETGDVNEILKAFDEKSQTPETNHQAELTVAQPDIDVAKILAAFDQKYVQPKEQSRLNETTGKPRGQKKYKARRQKTVYFGTLTSLFLPEKDIKNFGKQQSSALRNGRREQGQNAVVQGSEQRILAQESQRHSNQISGTTNSTNVPIVVDDDEADFIKKLRKTPFPDGFEEEDTLLVFPFDGNPEAINHTASGLREASWTTDLGTPGPASSLSNFSNTKSHRRHYVSLRKEDYKRLEPGELFNDVLVDLWMQWILRNENGSSSLVHVFTSHFYSQLTRFGAEGVASWTAKKGIDIFKKKYIFIPINKDYHWSHTVVVNPGSINNVAKEEKDSLEVPFIILMDSLKSYHKPKVIGERIRNWLNYEYQQAHVGSEHPVSFTDNTMPIIQPAVPEQIGGIDCGVFVCRYASAIYKIQDLGFKFRDLSNPDNLFSGRKEFDFNMDDIGRFRLEYRTLVQRLSHLYFSTRMRGKLETAPILCD